MIFIFHLQTKEDLTYQNKGLWEYDDRVRKAISDL